MDLKVPIVIHDELTESIVNSTGWLDLASGEIRNVEYQDYDLETDGLPADDEDYEFTSGTLSNDGKDVEFQITVDVFSGKYSVSATELLEIKMRAAKLFAGIDSQGLLTGPTGSSSGTAANATPSKPSAARKPPRR